MADFSNVFNDFFSTYKNTSQYKDQSMLDIALNKKAYEENLDEMWLIYSKGNVKQIVEYNKYVQNIKNAGHKVMRNSEGKHKIVLNK